MEREESGPVMMTCCVQGSRLMFGGKPSEGTPEYRVVPQPSDLLQQNRQLGLSLTYLHSHSSVFHAGVIGRGLKKTVPNISVPKVGNVLLVSFFYYDCIYTGIRYLWQKRCN